MPPVSLTTGGRTVGSILSGLGVKALTPVDPGIQQLAVIRSGEYPGLGPVQITPQTQAAALLGLIKDPLAGYVRPETGFDAFAQKLLVPALGAGFAATAGFGLGGIVGTGVKGLTTALMAQPGGRPMGFQDGDSGYFGVGDVFGGINEALQGSFGRQLLDIGGQALSGYVQQQFAPQPVSFGGPATMAAVPAIARAGAVVGRGFFNRFPNLATGIQQLRNMGKNVTRANLYSLMKRFGPDFLVTGGILTAAAVSELAMAGPGRRRMNPGNVKALRRAHRRMKSFHNVCMTNDRLLGGRRRSTKHRGFAPGTSVVSVK